MWSIYLYKTPVMKMVNSIEARLRCDVRWQVKKDVDINYSLLSLSYRNKYIPRPTSKTTKNPYPT